MSSFLDSVTVLVHSPMNVTPVNKDPKMDIISKNYSYKTYKQPLKTSTSTVPSDIIWILPITAKRGVNLPEMRNFLEIKL